MPIKHGTQGWTPCKCSVTVTDEEEDNDMIVHLEWSALGVWSGYVCIHTGLHVREKLMRTYTWLYTDAYIRVLTFVF